jgi:hypothetical protein
VPSDLILRPPAKEGRYDATGNHYAKSGDIHIAYQVIGHGELDLVFAPQGRKIATHNFGIREM